MTGPTSGLTGGAVSGNLPTPATWTTQTTSIAVPSDVTIANIDCEITGAFVDKMFLTPAPGHY